MNGNDEDCGIGLMVYGIAYRMLKIKSITSKIKPIKSKGVPKPLMTH